MTETMTDTHKGSRFNFIAIIYRKWHLISFFVMEGKAWSLEKERKWRFAGDISTLGYIKA